MRQRIKGIHAQKTRGDDPVADNGLKNDRCRADGKGRNQHGDQLGNTYLHGIYDKFHLIEIQSPKQV